VEAAIPDHSSPDHGFGRFYPKPVHNSGLEQEKYGYGMCNEYNSGQLSQEEYLNRVQELYDAEEKARQARHQMFAYVRRQAEASHAELDQRIAATKEPMGAELQGAMADMEGELQDMGDLMASKKSWMSFFSTPGTLNPEEPE